MSGTCSVLPLEGAKRRPSLACPARTGWLDFLRGLVRRGLQGVQLVTSDAHEGLKSALGQVLRGVTWQRCRVHFTRNILAHVPQGDKSMVAAAQRTIFGQTGRDAARAAMRVASPDVITIGISGPYQGGLGGDGR